MLKPTVLQAQQTVAVIVAIAVYFMVVLADDLPFGPSMGGP